MRFQVIDGFLSVLATSLVVWILFFWITFG